VEVVHGRLSEGQEARVDADQAVDRGGRQGADTEADSDSDTDTEFVVVLAVDLALGPEHDAAQFTAVDEQVAATDEDLDATELVPAVDNHDMRRSAAAVPLTRMDR
jgi:hypothetical protein